MDTFFIMHFLGSAPTPGVSRLLSLEPHVTFLARVDCDSQEAGEFLTAHVEAVTKRFSSLALAPSEMAFFGINKDIAVMKLNTSATAKALHEALLEAVSLHSGITVAQPMYTGENFIPHVSLESDETVVPEIITVNTLTVSRHIGGFGSGFVDTVGTFSLASS